MKTKNEYMVVQRPFKNLETGRIEIRNVTKHVSDCRPKEKGICPECGEPGGNYGSDHFEHKSRAGAVCSGKTKV